MSASASEPVWNEHMSLLYIQVSASAAVDLQRAALRIRQHVRRTDTVLLAANVCAVVLPATSLPGAQAVARRLSPLLASVDCEIQVLFGRAALIALKRLEQGQVARISAKAIAALPFTAGREEDRPPFSSLPYLAELSIFPAPKVLHLLPYALGEKHLCVPIGIERRRLTLATCASLDTDIVTHLEQVTQCVIFQVRCEASTIADLLDYWRGVEQKFPSVPRRGRGRTGASPVPTLRRRER